LTGLANCARLIEKLENMLAALPPTGGMVAVHFIDIDRFKLVNDALGHDGGDFLLNTLGQRLSAMTRIDDLVVRIGGDKFLVVQTEVTSKQQAEDFARRIASILSAPLQFKEQQIIAHAAGTLPGAGGAGGELDAHSHSIVPGGLLVTS
jgi:diguanylate cyclase (GGDEF)-like protein